MIILAGLFFFVSTKVEDMNSYENVIYSTKEMKNEFNSQNSDATNKDNLRADEIYLKDFTFLPSIEFTFMNQIDDKLESVAFQTYGNVIKLNSDNNQYILDSENLKQYAKFYVKILRRGQNVEKQTILRSDMVPCERSMFESLNKDKLADE